MPTADFLSSGLVALLAAWLGATVIARAPSDRGARTFGLMTGLLLVWAGAGALGQLSAEPQQAFLRQVEDANAYLLPAILLHMVVVLPPASRPKRSHWTAVVLVYVLTGLVAVRVFVEPGQPFAVTAERGQFAGFGIPGYVYGWAWVGIRMGILVLALVWAWRVLRRVVVDVGQRRQAIAVLAALLFGAGGGALRILPESVSGPDWVGNLLLAVGLGFATYAVFAQRVFLDPDVARRAFASSLSMGLAVVVYVGLLLLLEQQVQRSLGLTIPVVTPLALALTVALIDPLRDAYRRLVAPDAGAGAVRGRLVEAIGGGELARQPPDASIGPALARLVRQFRLRGGVIRRTDGSKVAAVGEDPAASEALQLPLWVNGEPIGSAAFAPKASGLPLTVAEAELLTDGVAYIAGALHLANRLELQADELHVLGRDRIRLDSQGQALHHAMLDAAEPAGGLHVFALGPLRAQRGGQLIRSWGGRKAGSRQAEAVFAFLFDRGERGVAKDEFLELIWPDVDLDRADLAFHRTLNGLRHTLEPARGRRASSAIQFFNDRYHLGEGVVAWSDVSAFEHALDEARSARTPDETAEALERARRLYRADYLDDCPFFGDSADVEERRSLLRGRFVDLLVNLGVRYEESGDHSSAANAYREALVVTGNECAPAGQGLERLGMRTA